MFPKPGTPSKFRFNKIFTLKWLCDPTLICLTIIPPAQLGYSTMPSRNDLSVQPLQDTSALIEPAPSALPSANTRTHPRSTLKMESYFSSTATGSRITYVPYTFPLLHQFSCYGLVI